MGLDLSAVDGIVEIEEGYLLGTLTIVGVPHYFTMIEVVEEDGIQVVAGESEMLDNMLYELKHFDNAESAYQTVSHAGKTYVIVITPYCV